MKQRSFTVIDVHLLLRKEQSILLLKRSQTGYMDGYYHVPAGHVEQNERLTDAIIRESREELGVILREENLRLVQVMHNKSDTERLGFFFEATSWKGEAQNMEPLKHSEITWFDLSNIPTLVVPYAKHALDCYRQNLLLTYFGW